MRIRESTRAAALVVALLTVFVAQPAFPDDTGDAAAAAEAARADTALALQ